MAFELRAFSANSEAIAPSADPVKRSPCLRNFLIDTPERTALMICFAAPVTSSRMSSSPASFSFAMLPAARLMPLMRPWISIQRASSAPVVVWSRVRRRGSGRLMLR